MRQVSQNYRTGILKVEDVPVPPLQEGGVLVANRVSLISTGTERTTVQLAREGLVGKAITRPDMVRKVLNKIHRDGLVSTVRQAFDRLDSPVALGYSCAGTILEMGKETDQFSIGDRVACAGQNYASHAEVVYVPKNLCVRVPEGVDFEGATFVTLGAIALQGIRQTEPRLGDRVAVIGLGLLGALTVQMLKLSGCQVLASDLDPARMQLARQLGADSIASPTHLVEAASAFTHGYGVDAVVITASTKENGPIQVAGAIARKKGRVVVVGAVGMVVPREVYYRKELELRLSASYGPGRYDPEYEEKGRDYPYGYVRWTENRNMMAFLELVQQGRVSTKPLVTHRFAIEEAERAYKLMLDNQEPYLGILITYPGGSPPKLNRIIHIATGRRLATVNLGVIGAGNHVRDRLLPALASVGGVQVRAVCTATGLRARAVAEKVQADYCTSDYREVLKDDSINAVLIGTRHDTHGVMVADALQAGKHVFVEKPLCLTVEELERIASVYEEKAKEGLLLMVGFNRRFSPHAAKAREFFAGRADPLVMAYRVNAGPLPADHWAHDPAVGGGRIVGEACHFVDYLQAVCGAPPTSVFARRIGTHSSGFVDDQSLLSFTFGDGSIGTVVYAAGGDAALSKERVEIFGDGKVLVMDDFQVSELFAAGERTTFRPGGRDKGFEEEMARFVRAVAFGEAPPVSFLEISAVTRSCLLAVESLRTGKVYPV